MNNKTHKDYESVQKFGKDNWFRITIICFLIFFSYQINEIRNDTKYIGSDDSVTIRYFSNDALNELRQIRDGR
jgi:hypothetical protein